MNILNHTWYESVLGTILLTGTANRLRGLFFVGQKRERPVPAGSIEGSEPFKEVLRQLDVYFAGKPVTFDVPVELEGTPFQQSVWRALQAIPRGKTMTYSQVAQCIGKPAAVRAVALANACNRISLIIPCHRVIGANGKLTGYAGGLERKRWLLEMESGEGLAGLGA